MKCLIIEIYHNLISALGKPILKCDRYITAVCKFSQEIKGDFLN